MPVLSFLADTNTVSDYFKPNNPVRAWFQRHRGKIALSTLTLAEMRRGIELRGDTKARRALERIYSFILEDYSGAILPFDETAAVEWGRLMAEARNHLPPLGDSLIAAIARGNGLAVITRNGKHLPGCQVINPWRD